MIRENLAGINVAKVVGSDKGRIPVGPSGAREHWTAVIGVEHERVLHCVAHIGWSRAEGMLSRLEAILDSREEHMLLVFIQRMRRRNSRLVG